MVHIGYLHNSLSQTAIFVLPRFHLCTFSNCTLRKRKKDREREEEEEAGEGESDRRREKKQFLRE